MVQGAVNTVDTNSVDSKLLEVLEIACAVSQVSDGILDVGRTAWLVIDSSDIEALIASEECCSKLVRDRQNSSD